MNYPNWRITGYDWILGFYPIDEIPYMTLFKDPRIILLFSIERNENHY